MRLLPPRRGLDRVLRRRRAIQRYGWNLRGCGGRANSQLLAKFSIDAREDVLVFLEEVAHVFASLTDAFAGVTVPRAALLNDVVGYRKVEDVALARDTLAVEDGEFSLAERSCDLVLHDLGART